MMFEIVVEYGAAKTEKRYRVEANTLDELKTAFLKRFGNIKGAPNSCLKEKPLVKQLTYAAESTVEWMDTINLKTRWTLKIRKTD